MRLKWERVFWLSFLAVCGSSGAQACKKKDEGAAAPLIPPTLEFLGAETLTGREFEPGDDIELGCDSSLILHLGPEGDDPGTIENWTLFPRHICGSLQQCGYVSYEILTETGVVLASEELAAASLYFDLSGVDLSEVAEIRATLILGDSGIPFQVDGVVVAASWQAQISSTCDAFGGAGGGGPGPATGGSASTGGSSPTGGQDGSGGTESPLGGAGGMGGGLPD